MKKSKPENISVDEDGLIATDQPVQDKEEDWGIPYVLVDPIGTDNYALSVYCWHNKQKYLYNKESLHNALGLPQTVDVAVVLGGSPSREQIISDAARMLEPIAKAIEHQNQESFRVIL